MNIVAIIQARMKSTRLPGKVLADICGKPMLHYVIARAKRAKMANLVVVATSADPADDLIEEFCAANAVPCFRGSENDVLERYYRAAMQFDANIIVRLTADCPLIDPLVIDQVTQRILESNSDYVSNVLQLTFPDGLDTEVLTFDALARAWHEATLPSEREHVTSYIINRPNLFRLGCIKNNVDLSQLRWTVDKPEDLELIRKIYRSLGCNDTIFSTGDVLSLLRKYPHLGEINAGLLRNEGYLRSLERDQLQAAREP